MALSEFELRRIERYVGQFVASKRPPKNLRHKLDVGFRVYKQSFEIYEVRPRFDRLGEVIETMVAKATYVKNQKTWKLYWMRADFKWHSYPPFPSSKSLEEILEAIDDDIHGCFWG